MILPTFAELLLCCLQTPIIPHNFHLNPITRNVIAILKSLYSYNKRFHFITVLLGIQQKYFLNYLISSVQNLPLNISTLLWKKSEIM